jgi:predicted methyltransferase
MNLCNDCDGSGLDTSSGNGWWDQDECATCGGTGLTLERRGLWQRLADLLRSKPEPDRIYSKPRTDSRSSIEYSKPHMPNSRRY